MRAAASVRLKHDVETVNTTHIAEAVITRSDNHMDIQSWRGGVDHVTFNT